MMSDDLEVYNSAMTEMHYWNTLNEFLLVCQHQGYYSVISELCDLCPISERGMFFEALQHLVSQDERTR
jgi:hypothetical protein